MKKYLVLCAGLCLALSFTSCKSSDKAYRQAYDKAKQQSAIQDPYETPVVQQVQTARPSLSPRLRLLTTTTTCRFVASL